MNGLLVIPTRNRPDLAIGALRSVRKSSVETAVVVSDNSDASQAELKDACSAEGATYVRPPGVLAMPDHWEWALREGRRVVPDATHVTFLTDRMLLKRGALDRLFALAEREPTSLISWSHDKIGDGGTVVMLYQEEGTRRVYWMDTGHLIRLASRAVLPQCLPRMMNSLAPVEVVDRVHARFGRVFGSVSPDYLFAFRALDTCDRILFLDEPLMAHRAQSRSNGESYALGLGAEAETDFAEHLREQGLVMNHATPLPEIRSIVNAMLNEYCVVRGEVADDGRFPPLDLPSYARALRSDIESIRSPAIREDMRRRLPHVDGPDPQPPDVLRTRVRGAIHRLSARPRPARAFRELQRLGLRPTAGPWSRFGSVEEAMTFLEEAPRPAPSWPYHLHTVLDDAAVVELASPRCCGRRG